LIFKKNKMKALKSGLLSLTMLLAVATAKAQTADEVISKHVTAIGGAAAWKGVTSIRREANFNVQGTDVTLIITTLQGKGTRQDISVMSMDGYSIITPAKGWSYLPFQGQTTVMPTPDEDVKASQDALDIAGILVDYKTKTTAVELAGRETIDGAECFKLKATNSQGKVTTYYIDPKTYYIVRSSGTQRANGQDIESTANYSHYTKLPEGIVVPMSFTRAIGGSDVDVTITKVEVNKPVDEAIFKPS
jgi:outer membrane lipoprotein-sorting protein